MLPRPPHGLREDSRAVSSPNRGHHNKYHFSPFWWTVSVCFSQLPFQFSRLRIPRITVFTFLRRDYFAVMTEYARISFAVPEPATVESKSLLCFGKKGEEEKKEERKVAQKFMLLFPLLLLHLLPSPKIVRRTLTAMAMSVNLARTINPACL